MVYTSFSVCPNIIVYTFVHSGVHHYTVAFLPWIMTPVPLKCTGTLLYWCPKKYRFAALQMCTVWCPQNHRSDVPHLYTNCCPQKHRLGVPQNRRFYVPQTYRNVCSSDVQNLISSTVLGVSHKYRSGVPQMNRNWYPSNLQKTSPLRSTGLVFLQRCTGVLKSTDLVSLSCAETGVPQMYRNCCPLLEVTIETAVHTDCTETGTPKLIPKMYRNR